MEQPQYLQWLYAKCRNLSDQCREKWMSGDPYKLYLVGTPANGRVKRMRILSLAEYENMANDMDEPLETLMEVSPAWAYDTIAERIRQGLARVPCLPLVSRLDAAGNAIDE